MEHVPVLLREALAYLAIRPDGLYLDATAGLGGHTAEIARLVRTGKVIAADRDAESLEIARRNTQSLAGRIQFVQARFSELRDHLKELAGRQADGLLADLGVSRYQLTDAGRGFSFAINSPLDMRADRSQTTTAADLVNYMAEKALADLIFQFGEERRARRIARAIVRARPIRSTSHLAEVVERVAPRTGPRHPATQTFMALRIAVNRELDELDALLDSLPDLVGPRGRAVFLTYMSLEDRRVKQAFQGMVQQGRATSLTKHVVRPDQDEVRGNPASRSAKLRALEMK